MNEPHEQTPMNKPKAAHRKPAPPIAGRYPDRPFSPRRIGAMALRYLFLLRSSWTRIVELAYWPIMQMILWGFMTEFLLRSGSPVLKASGMLIAAVLLWDVMFRSNIGVAISFLEEMWSRNLAQLFASPLRPYEWALSLLTISLVRTLVGVLPAALLAIPLYHYSIFEMGLPLIAFFANLMLFGGAVGLAVSALILRYGLGAESLAWATWCRVLQSQRQWYAVVGRGDGGFVAPVQVGTANLEGVLGDPVEVPATDVEGDPEGRIGREHDLFDVGAGARCLTEPRACSISPAILLESTAYR